MGKLAMPPPPPMPKWLERRAHPRVQLFCAVRVLVDEGLALAVRDFSLGGIALAADGLDLSRFTVGSCHELLVFDAADEHLPTVRAIARVVRHDPLGMAMTWAGNDPGVSEQLRKLMAIARG